MLPVAIDWCAHILRRSRCAFSSVSVRERARLQWICFFVSGWLGFFVRCNRRQLSLHHIHRKRTHLLNYKQNTNIVVQQTHTHTKFAHIFAIALIRISICFCGFVPTFSIDCNYGKLWLCQANARARSNFYEERFSHSFETQTTNCRNAQMHKICVATVTHTRTHTHTPAPIQREHIVAFVLDSHHNQFGQRFAFLLFCIRVFADIFQH